MERGQPFPLVYDTLSGTVRNLCCRSTFDILDSPFFRLRLETRQATAQAVHDVMILYTPLPSALFPQTASTITFQHRLDTCTRRGFYHVQRETLQVTYLSLYIYTTQD
jgi:hypothetical protein